MQLYPEEIRSDYVRNIRVHYRAEEIVYVLQALSTGMTSIFIGLITNYLYDKTKKSDPKIEALTKQMEEQRVQLRKLEELLLKEKDSDFAEIAKKHRELHRRIIAQAQDSDPEIERMVDEVLLQLNERGRKGLADEVDSYDF
ncbi:hypothetical protein FQZ97_1037870 [compost metagenome]